MMLECSVCVQNYEMSSHSYNRFVLGNLHLGLLVGNTKPIPYHLHLCVVTATKTLKYRILENVKRVNSKELPSGKMSIQFISPSHSILIRCNNGKLPKFFQLFEKLCDEELKFNPRKIPKIPTDLKFSCKPIVHKIDSSMKEIISQIPCLMLRKVAMKNTHILHLPNSNVKNLPVQLGFLCWSEINLENNNLSNVDLLWLEELPIRRTLTILNLSKNKITTFPAALVDFQCLGIVNFKDNKIQYIPGGIGSLLCLRNLNLSNNEIRYLPASIANLKLDDVDLTNNYLTCNKPVKNVPPERKIYQTIMRLEDIASTKIDSLLRRQLTNKECPRRLLEKLRCSSQCVCGKMSMPSAMNEYYLPLPAIRFSSGFCILPQKFEQTSSIFLQYHFCVFSNKCSSKKLQKLISPYFSLM